MSKKKEESVEVKIFSDEEIKKIADSLKFSVDKIYVSDKVLNSSEDYMEFYKKSKGSYSEFCEPKIFSFPWCFFYGIHPGEGTLHKVTEEGGKEISKYIIDPNTKWSLK